MAIVVSLADHLPDKTSRKLGMHSSEELGKREGARILLFTGIRYERLPEPPKGRRPRKAKLLNGE